MSQIMSIKVLLLSVVLGSLTASCSAGDFSPKSKGELQNAVQDCAGSAGSTAGGAIRCSHGAMRDDQAILKDCTISYFRLPGLAEPIRMALAVSGVEFNEDTLDFPAFKRKKENGEFPFGQVPVLTLADGVQIAQSRSIERFVAKYSGLYPDDPVAAAHVDAVLDAIGDFWKAVMTSTAGVDKTSPEFLEKRKECAATGALAQGLANLENFLRKTGTVGYAVGNTHTIADIHLLAHITFMGSGFWDGIPADYANRFTRITSIRQNIASHRSIKAYYDSKATKNNYDDLYIKARDLPTSDCACEQSVQVLPKPNGCLKDLYSKSVLEDCTLTYFALPGRGEAIRMALAVTGVNYNEQILDFAEFKTKKERGDFPFGSLPVLTLADGTQIAQSRAIERFVAKYCGLYTYHNPVTTAHVDAVLDAVEDLSEAIMKCTRGIDPKTPEFLEKRQECVTTGSFGQGLQKLENFLLKTGTVGFAVGNTHTIADIRLLAAITFLGSGFFDGIAANFADRFTRINSIRRNIARHPSIQAYYDKKTEKSRFDHMYIAAREFT